MASAKQVVVVVAVGHTLYRGGVGHGEGQEINVPQAEAKPS